MQDALFKSATGLHNLLKADAIIISTQVSCLIDMSFPMQKIYIKQLVF
ncbi:hypothetical protein RINTHM_10040 [Richelia intracellularis HM01]|nr:hypothetical protein RINTHM_10040 [Richelia intracellularis HM01]